MLSLCPPSSPTGLATQPEMELQPALSQELIAEKDTVRGQAEAEAKPEKADKGADTVDASPAHGGSSETSTVRRGPV